jgi:hypothetical protein
MKLDKYSDITIVNLIEICQDYNRNPVTFW